MADPHDQVPIDDAQGPLEEPPETRPPTRAASASFVVDDQVGTEAAIRAAMDPANQSLAEALRLSYRVLQGVIVVLIVLLFVSGVALIEKNESGVMLRFGKITPVNGAEALEPGRAWNKLPSPAGEFVIFDVEGRVDLRNTFWPSIPPNLTEDQAIDQARIGSALRPGRDGSVITRDGDLAHLQVDGVYQITDPVQFVGRIKLSDTRRVMELVLQRAVLHELAGLGLQEMIDHPPVDLIQQNAQQALDDMKSGIELTRLTIPNRRPPFAIVKAFGELQNALEQAREARERAHQDAEEMLIKTAGPNYKLLARPLAERRAGAPPGLIDQYEEATRRGDEAEAESLLTQINEFLESDKVSGDVSEVIYYSKAFDAEIDTTLGNLARRFQTLRPSYLNSPDLVIRQNWLRTVRAVLGRQDTEIIYVPAGVGTLRIRIRGQEDMQQLRQKLQLEKKEREATQEALRGRRPYYRRADSYDPDRSLPILKVRDGKVVPRGRRP